MSYLDNHEYSIDHQFTTERLAQIKPPDLMRWLNFRVYGTEHPEDDAKPNKRHTAIAFWKKAISYYMPNKNMVFNELSNVGNPTKSAVVNDLVKRVKRKEVRKQGVAPKAQCDMEDAEYREILKVLRNNWGTNIIVRYGCPAVMNFQHHYIARIDDTCMSSMDNIQGHPQFSFALKARLTWSKNVMEERDAPWQVMLGSMDHD